MAFRPPFGFETRWHCWCQFKSLARLSLQHRRHQPTVWFVFNISRVLDGDEGMECRSAANLCTWQGSQRTWEDGGKRGRHRIQMAGRPGFFLAMGNEYGERKWQVTVDSDKSSSGSTRWLPLFFRFPFFCPRSVHWNAQPQRDLFKKNTFYSFFFVVAAFFPFSTIVRAQRRDVRGKGMYSVHTWTSQVKPGPFSARVAA